MTDDKTRQLENRIDKLEKTIEKMMPSRRDALKMGGAALIGGAAMSGTASAGTNQVGTIGDKDATPPKLVDLHSEDIDNADTITTDSLTATNNDNTGTVTTDDLVVNGTATGPFGGGGLVFEEGDSITQIAGDSINVGADTFFDVLNVGSPVDVYGGAVYSRAPDSLRITFGSNNTQTFGDFSGGQDGGGDFYGIVPIFPMKSVKRIEVRNGDSLARTFGFRLYTT